MRGNDGATANKGNSLTDQQAPLLTLKIDVDTYRGTRERVGNLVRMLSQHGVGATFLFSLGPDHT